MLMRLNQRKKELRRLNTLGTKPHDNWIIFLQETHLPMINLANGGMTFKDRYLSHGTKTEFHWCH